MSAIAWTTVQNALHAWIVAGSGLDSDHVIWTGQNGPRPDEMFCELRLTLLPRLGRDWIDHAVESGNYVSRLRGPRRAIFTVQCFQGTSSPAVGETSCLAVLDDAMSAFALESITAALVVAGVGVSSIEAAQVTDQTLNTARNEQRAFVTAQINLTSEITETVIGQGWISNVNGEGESDLLPVSIEVSDT